MKYGLGSILITICVFFSACTPYHSIQPTTNTFIPTVNSSITSTPTSLTPTPCITPTPKTQIFGRIFKDGMDSAGVSCNINTGNPDSRNTHFDIAVPGECRSDLFNCPVYSPVDGTVWEIYSVGDPKGSEGQVVSIHLSDPPSGIEKALDELNINPDTVTRYSIHLGHLVELNPELKEGSMVSKGSLIANGVNNAPEPKVALVLYIWMTNNSNFLQLSPCSVKNTASFCGICFQYKGYCPETDMNFPDGGVEWWNESDPFWDTHELSQP